MINHDVLSPPKRSRQIQIPFRQGSYTAGPERYFNDRQIRVECQLSRQLSKGDFREITHVLSQRNALFFWDEPDKFYRAELFESVDVTVFPREVGRNFILPFICEPFAYGPQRVVPLQSGLNGVEYNGTAETPTMIVIRNPNAFPVERIVITTISQTRI